MKLSEIPGIGDIYDMELSELRQKVSSEMKKNKATYEALKAIGAYLFQIEKNIAKIQKACETDADRAEESNGLYQHIGLIGFVWKWSEISRHENEDGEFVLLAPDNGGLLNVLCRVNDDCGLSVVLGKTSDREACDAIQTLNGFKKSEVKNI